MIKPPCPKLLFKVPIVRRFHRYHAIIFIVKKRTVTAPFMFRAPPFHRQRGLHYVLTIYLHRYSSSSSQQSAGITFGFHTSSIIKALQAQSFEQKILSLFSSKYFACKKLSKHMTTVFPSLISSSLILFPQNAH